MFDDHPISEFSEISRSKQISFVTQDIHLFNRSAKENILYSNQDFSEEEMIEISKSSLSHEFISKLSEGYDTLIGNKIQNK